MTTYEQPLPCAPVTLGATPVMNPTVFRRRRAEPRQPGRVRADGGPPSAPNARRGGGGGGGSSPMAAFWTALRGALEGSAGR
jgi:hypothetical protein